MVLRHDFINLNITKCAPAQYYKNRLTNMTSLKYVSCTSSEEGDPETSFFTVEALI